MPRLPSPRKALGAIRERLRSGRYLAEDFVFALARVPHAAIRVPRALGRGAREFWLSLNIYTRRRLGVAVAAVAVVAAIWLVAVPALPCAVPGGDKCPPTDHAIGLVPGDALGYVHVELDPDTAQYEQASETATRIPTLSRVAAGTLLEAIPGPRGAPVDFGRDVEPWFGGEAALAIVPAPGGVPEQVVLLEASDSSDAERFARSVAAGGAAQATYRDVEVRVDARGLATALVGGFLLIGTEQGVHEVIDAESGTRGARSLADSTAADEAIDALPDEHLADAFISEDGIAQLVSRPRGLLAQLSPFIDPGASRGAAAALVANHDGFEVAVRSILDPKRAKATPGFFSAFPPFDPTLTGALPADSLAYVGIGDPGGALRSLLELATAEQPGLAEAFTALVRQVSKVGGVNLEKDLLPSLGSEAAFALEPAPGGDHDGERGAPYAEFLARDVDEEGARDALARLQTPVAQALNPNSELQAPSFSSETIQGVEAQSLKISPTLDLTYAVFDGAAVVATDPAGVEQAVVGEGGLGDSECFERATAGLAGEPQVLGYFDLRGLISLAEEAGLAADPAYATFAGDARLLDALGLTVSTGPDELSTEARLIVGEAAGEDATGVPAPSD